jgi:hypothetical protein
MNHYNVRLVASEKATSDYPLCLMHNVRGKVIPALGHTQPPIQWVPGAISLRMKRSGREADHSPPSSAKVKECVELDLHSPNTPSWCGSQLKHRDNFYSSLCLTKYYAMKTYSVLKQAPRHEDVGGIGCIAPRILNLSTRGR